MLYMAAVVKWIERLPGDRKVVSSNPRLENLYITVGHGAARPLPCVTDFIVQKEEKFFPSPGFKLTTFRSSSRRSIHYTTAAE
jgi:hypothetical protein